MKRALLFLTPLFIVVVLWRVQPAVYNECGPGDPPINPLDPDLYKQGKKLGSLLNYDFYVLYDDISCDTKYFQRADEHEKNALVISADTGEAPKDSVLVRSVRKAIEKVSVPAANTFDNKVKSGGFPKSIPLGRDDNWKSFPIDFVYVVGIDLHDNHADQERSIGSGLHQVIALADRDGVSNLIIPTLGIDLGPVDSCPREKPLHNVAPRNSSRASSNMVTACYADRTSELSQFFHQIFESASPRMTSARVYLTVLKRTNPEGITQAVKSANRSWASNCRSRPRFFDENDRLVFLSLAVCLLVCSFWDLSWMMSGFVAVSYVMLAYGSLTAIEKPEFISNADPHAKFWIHVTALLILAVVFPQIQRLDLKAAFKVKQEGSRKVTGKADETTKPR